MSTQGPAAEAAIRNYQQDCFRCYLADVGEKVEPDGIAVPDPYTYPDGNPIRPLPPLHIACGGLMIVGAYPSARFEFRPSKQGRGRHRLVPVADNLHPFAEEKYFDGQRVRTLVSGDGLRDHLLTKLGLRVEDCWITDLVKVFLYKPEHEDSCGDACPGFHVPQLRTSYAKLAKASLPWLVKECALCQPKLVVTLGEEVAQAVSEKEHATADDLLKGDVQHPERLNGVPVMYLPHPDACRRTAKWRKKMADFVKLIRPLLGLQGEKP
ncbi:MAG: uracil-DNA glycosylase family protein [Planctomycetota bacterium]